MGTLTKWLLREEPLRVVPFMDRIVVIFLKFLYIIFYLVIRISLRIVLGRKRRDELMVKRGIRFNYELDIIPTFLLIKISYSILRFLKFGRTPFLLRITVPKYDYKAYCPINKNDLLSMTIREDEIIERFNPKRGDIVIDIGAHFGRYTIIASKRVGLNGQVVAIEADPNNFEMLNRNIELNKLTNVIALNYAVYSRPAKIKLYLAGQESGHTIYSTVMSDRAQSEEKFVDVEANTLDLLMQSNGIKQEDVNWIKIDVEGAEYEVLKGATNILSKSKDISLLIEIHNLSLGMNQYKPISEFLNSYHFKIDYEKTYEGGERHIIARKN
jgi:FkbM family methyltransferase